jgi:soluble cytochrome b562
MRTKVIDPDKEKKKAEATKLRNWAFYNLSVLVSSGILSLSDLPSWINCIRQARMLEDIQTIWLTTETVIKMKNPKAKTACDEARYQEGFKELIKLSMSERTSSTGGVRAVQS